MYFGTDRALDIRAAITLASGAQLALDASQIVRYSVNESSGGEGLPLGAAEASSFTLSLDNAGKSYEPAMFDNAEVHVQIGIVDNSTAWQDFGVWYVTDVSAPEQSVTIELSGTDALATLFEVTYTDSAGAYPTTMASLALAMCAAAGVQLSASDFFNAGVSIAAMPAWGEDITLRQIVSHIAACAGGFARMDRSGKLRIASYTDGETYALDAELYTALTRTNGTAFTFNALEVRHGDDADFTRYAIHSGTEDNPTNTIQVENNPLFTSAIASSVANKLRALSAAAASVSWVGSPEVHIGDRLRITDMRGGTLNLLINAQTLEFAGGLSAVTDCVMPSVNSGTSSAYSSSGSVLDSSGNVNAQRISGLDRSVVTATTAHFERLTASSVLTDTLLASVIQAVNLLVDKLDAKVIQAASITADKLAAGAIDADAINAFTAHIQGALSAGSIDASELTAALAAFTVLTAANAQFDRAAITHLVASALNLSYGVGEDVFIENLRVTAAQLVSATVGELCIRASNGSYYRLDVDAGGCVTATPASVTQGEKDAGVTSEGRVIVETDITAASLSTATLLASYALVSRIDAARIDVDELFAREAFIDRLRTRQIVGDKSIELIAGDVAAAQSTADTAQSTADGAFGQANTAYSAASTAQTTADAAQSTADTAQLAAEDAQIAADDAFGQANDAYSAANTAQTTADAAQAEFRRVVRIDADGVRVFKEFQSGQSTQSAPCATLVTEEAFHVEMNGRKVATFGASHIAMQEQPIVRVTSQGLIFGG